MHGDMIPAEETVQLRMILSPCAGLHHQIRRFDPGFYVRRQLTKNRSVSAECRVADIKLYKKCFLLSGRLFLPGKGVPPPVISLIF